ncbi:MAG: hypothetical protein ACOCNX_00720 [Prevotella sp.]
MDYDYYEEMAREYGWNFLTNINDIPLHKEIVFTNDYTDKVGRITRSFTSNDEVFDFWINTRFNYWRVKE